MTDQARYSSAAWRSQGQFVTTIASARQLQTFNDIGGFAINFDVMRSITPDIAIAGSKNETLCLWETRSASGFVTKPRHNADLITIRFVTNGHIAYTHRASNAIGTPTHATLVGFEDLSEVQASHAFSALNGTITVEALVSANAALTGEPGGLPPLASIAETDTPGMQALFCTMRQVQRRSREIDPYGDLVLPLLQEVISYQVLSAWPLRMDVRVSNSSDVSDQSMRRALDYIQAHLSTPLTLAVISAAAGVSVRSLQDKFRRKIGRTPIQFIIDQRLANAHRDLISARKADLTIADIAKRWGFVHMSDFGQRYKRMYGCTPSRTRREAMESPVFSD